jgi:phosphoglucomutase
MWRQELELTYGNEITELKNQLASLQNRYDYITQRNTENANLHYTQENKLRTYLTDNYDELQEHADYIASIFDIEITRDVTYSVQMNATVTVAVPVGEDGEEMIIENLYIDANHGDIVIDDYEVCTVRESY